MLNVVHVLTRKTISPVLIAKAIKKKAMSMLLVTEEMFFPAIV